MNSKKTKTLIIGTILLFTPLFVFAQSQGSDTDAPSKTTTPVVVAKDDNSNTGITYRCTGGAAGECTFDDVIRAIDNLMKWGRNFALLFSFVVIAIAGGRYMISGDNPGERTKANQMLLSVIKGIVVILAASLMVHLIVGALLKETISFI